MIDYASGQLTIHATNSSLRAILDTLQTQTGTKIDGLTKDERIYGVYGPGPAQAVLASLLDDSGYNVLIAGRSADGAPREISLSARSQAPAAAAQGITQAAQENDDTEDTAPTGPAFPLPQQPMPTTPAAAPGAPQQVKTPQQMLEELQKIRQGAAQAASGSQAPQ